MSFDVLESSERESSVLYGNPDDGIILNELVAGYHTDFFS